MKFWHRIKEALNKYFTEMEKENKRQFGSGTPNCCNLNSQQKKNHN